MKLKHIAILLCILFLMPLASAASLTLDLVANPSTVLADGHNYSKVRANLTDGSSPVVGAYINFTIGSKTLVVKTNSSGIATIVVGPSSSIQTVVITASNLSGSPTNSTTVNFVPGAPASIYLIASPSSVGTRSITSNYTSLLTALVVDAYRNPVPNQQVNFSIYLKKNGNVSNPPDFTLNPAGTNDSNGNVNKTINTNTNGIANLTFNSGNTSGTAYITAKVDNLTPASSTLKVMGESYLLVETSVEPESIDPPAIVNVTISVKGGGDKWAGGLPVDAMLVTDISGSMDPDWYNRWDDGEPLFKKGFTEYKFKANGTVPKKTGGVDGQWNTTFYLNESVNDLWFKLNVSGLRLQLRSPSGKVYGYNGGANNSPNYMYSYYYTEPLEPGEWVWFKPDSTPGNTGYYPTSADSDFPEQGNWTIKVYNSGSSPITFNLTTYIEKLSAAKTASKTFNALLNPAYDRVGLVPFSDDPYPLALYQLTSDIAYINGRIDSIFSRSGTPTASAIKTATDELEAKKRPDVSRYLILLSDGQPTVDLSWDYCNSETASCKPVTEAKSEANTSKAKGIRIYAIGIGVDVNETTMRAIASPDSYYFAANASQLKDIYGSIGKQITNISAMQASLNISLSSGQSYSANGTYVAGSSRQKYITSDNVTTEYGCTSNACEPNTTSPLYWNITTPYPPDNRTIKIGDQWILKFQLNLSNDGMLFDLEKSLVEYLNYTGKNLNINVPGAKVTKNATTLKPQGLLVKTVILTPSKDRVKPNGVSSSTVTATVYDEEGNLVPDGTNVTFDTNFGSFSNHSITFNVTTSNGIATAKIYSEVAGPAQINARSWADWQWPNYVPSNPVNVTFAYNKIITIS